MGIIEYLKNKKKDKEMTLVARNNLAELQNGEETPAIRLYYVALEQFKRYGTNNLCIGQTYGISSPFVLPKDMSLEDACKVVSFLSDKVEKENNLEPAGAKSVSMVSNILEKYGFEKIDGKEKGYYHTVTEYDPFHKIESGLPVCNKIDGVVDLFSVNGDFKLFKKSDLHDRYFDWYSEGITQQEITKIYKNIHQENLLSTSASEDDKTR